MCDPAKLKRWILLKLFGKDTARMHCPSCHSGNSAVIDSRVIEEGSRIRRRRACPQCAFRFSTIEELEILSLTVVKRDGRAEPYNKEKLLAGLRIALHKRPVSPLQLRKILHAIEEHIQSKARHDKISSQDIGAIAVKYLKRLDKIATIRFASVYHSFGDLKEFSEEIQKFRRKGKSKGKLARL